MADPHGVVTFNPSTVNDKARNAEKDIDWKNLCFELRDDAAKKDGMIAR